MNLGILATICVLIVNLIIGAGSSAATELEAWLDRNQVSLGETVELTIQGEGRLGSGLDTSVLEEQFDLLGTSSESSVQFGTGGMHASTALHIRLRPKQEGKLAIPPLTIDGRSTPPLTVSVSSSPAPTAASGGDIFIETELAPDQPFVRQQVLYRVRLFHAVELAEGTLSAPEAADTVVRQLGEDRRYAATRNGRRFKVVERSYALFPTRSGELSIAAPVFDGKVVEKSSRPDPFFGMAMPGLLGVTTRPTRIVGEKNRITVLAPPPDAAADGWLPAQDVTVSEEWQPGQLEIKVGEAITRTITITARGQEGEALPDLLPAEIEGFKIYPDKAEVTGSSDDDGVSGSRKRKIAMIPLRAGTFTLPETRLPWWDSENERLQVALLPAKTMTVLPGNPASGHLEQPVSQQNSPPAPPPVPATAASPAHEQQLSSRTWPLLTMLFALLWIATLLVWRRDRSRWVRAEGGAKQQNGRIPPESVHQARLAFHQACRENDPSRARAALLAWAALQWPLHPPRGLQELAGQLHESAAAEEVMALQRTLYGGAQGSWNGEKLARLLEEFSRDAAPQRLRATDSSLPPLYP